MGKKRIKPTPIMDRANERFMAFTGLLQWLHAIDVQANRISSAMTGFADATPELKTEMAMQRQVECDFFVLAAFKVWEYKNWAVALRVCPAANFVPLLRFFKRDLRDLRNMRIHQVDYFRGLGMAKGRWNRATRKFIGDASGVAVNLIGGRLDYVAFGAAAAQVHSVLAAKPIPYPPGPPRP